MKKKTTNPKLVKTTIINKLGHKQTVYIRPDDPRSGLSRMVEEGKNKKLVRLQATPVLRRKEVINVSRKGKVYYNPDTYEGLQVKYEQSKPITWKLMTKGEWKVGKEGKVVKLTPQEWSKLVKENDKLVHFVAKKYAFGEVYSERYKELKAVGQAALVEAVNKYHKAFNKENPFDFAKFAYAYVNGRIKESVANRLDAGLRIPKGLQKPYQEFIAVRNRLQGKLGVKPRRELIAKELQKSWTKQSFYPQYIVAEGRTYGEQYLVKDKKGKIVYKGMDIKKAKAVYKKGFSFEKTTRAFKDLTAVEKKVEKTKDLLPMSGWVSVSKEGVVKNKEEKHEENLSKIEEEYQKRQEDLEATYYSTNNMGKQDKQRAEQIIGILQKRVDDNQEKIQEQKRKKIDELILLEAEVETLEDKLKTYKTKTSKAYKDTIKKISELKSDRYRDEKVKDINNKLKDLFDTEKRLLNDLRMSKQIFEPMTEQEFEKRKEQLEFEKKDKIANETHRYNKDTSSSLIPGVIDRIKEFEQIESIKELPLNLQVESEDDGSRSNLEVTYSPDAISEEEKFDLLQQHDLGKIALRGALDLLVPVYKDIMSLRMGLHKDSPPTVDNLWGELATAKDIEKYLDKKHKVLLANPDRFVDLISKMKNEADRYLMIRSVPYVNNRYFYNPTALLNDFDKWRSSQPKTGKLKKVKIDMKKYKQLKTKWLNAKKEANKKWKIWRKKNPKAKQEVSTKVYNKLKEQLRASRKYEPKKFIMVKDKKVNPKLVKQWQERKPKIFSESSSAKESFILNGINESTEILRRVVPLYEVKSLLAAHRRLVETGVSINKAMPIFNKVHYYFSKSFAERIV